MTDTFREGLDALNDALERAEVTLHSLKMGVEAKVVIRERDGVETFLAYGFTQAAKKGVHRTLHTLRNGDQQPISSHGIEMKKAAAEAIPALVDALRESRHDRGESMRIAADDLLDYLGGLLDAFDEGTLHETP